MLAHILAIAVGLGSFAVYMAAFFFPEVHRKNDFFWSGVGFFYALILWVCAGRITGAVLLGQIASVALLGWFGLQTLYLRRVVTPISQKTPVPAKLQEQVEGLFAVQAQEPQVIPVPKVDNFDEDGALPVAPPAPSEPAGVEYPPETVTTEPQIPVSSEIPSEIPEVLEEVSPSVEPELTAETVIESEDEPVIDPPLPEPISPTKIEWEDEEIEEETETISQPQTPSNPGSQPKRLSRVFRSITGLFNRGKNPPSSPVPVVETSQQNQSEAAKLEPETKETPTLETVVAQEDITPKSEQSETSAVAETEAIDLTEIDSVPGLETPSEDEFQEITVTVEPDISSASPFAQMTSASEESEIVQSEDSAEEIVSESSTQNPSPPDETQNLKRPNPPNPDLKEAAKKQNKSTDSER